MSKGDRTRVSRRAVAAGLVLAGGGGWWLWQAQAALPVAAQRLSPEQVHDAAISQRVLLIDIRRPDEWTLTGLGQGAVPLDMRRGDFVTALRDLSGGDTDRAIALICAAGVRSARLSARLQKAGFTQIIDVPEGMTGSAAGPGWLRRGLPVVPWSEG